MDEKKETFQKSATIVDVAKMANVSISTVSRVINSQGGVSDELEKRILEVINQLNYRPNSVARALKSKATRLIGVIVPSISNPVFSDTTEYYAAAAEKYGYSLIVCSSNSLVENEVKCVHSLIKHQVDGMIFNAMGQFDPRFSIINESKIPTVFIGRRPRNFRIDCDSVTVNNETGAYQAVSYLIESGARRIGFIFGQHESMTAAEDRYQGYLEALRDHGIEPDASLVVHTNASEEDAGRLAAKALLAQVAELDGVFTSTDLAALGCMHEFRQCGIRIPEDISIMGFDGITYGRLMTPPLSTVVTPNKEMAKTAVGLLIERIEEQKTSQRDVVFQPTLFIGGSTKTVPTP